MDYRTEASKIRSDIETFVSVAEKLYGCSAETRLIIQTTERVARAYGYPEVQAMVSSDIICVSLVAYGESHSLTRKSVPIGIDMSVLTEITHLCLEAEKKSLPIEEFRRRLKNITPDHYKPLPLCLMIGAATFAFGILNGGSWKTAVTGFIAGTLVMLMRLLLQKFSLFPLFVFSTLGFIGTIISYFIGTYIFDLPLSDLRVSLVIAVLLLVPGFPFVNGVLDMFKGYLSMGVVRLLRTTILLIAVSLGISIALRFLPTGLWNF